LALTERNKRLGVLLVPIAMDGGDALCDCVAVQCCAVLCSVPLGSASWMFLSLLSCVCSWFVRVQSKGRISGGSRATRYRLDAIPENLCRVISWSSTVDATMVSASAIPSKTTSRMSFVPAKKNTDQIERGWKRQLRFKQRASGVRFFCLWWLLLLLLLFFVPSFARCRENGLQTRRQGRRLPTCFSIRL
jgi:hypothetical protein